MAGGVELLFGPLLIGVFLNCILYGIMVVQTHMYFERYKRRDPRWFKIFVLYLLFCETLNTLCDMGMMYEPLAIRYGTQRAVTITPIMLSTDPILTVMVSSPVQLFIAWRVRVVSRSTIVPAVICFLAFTSFIGGVATAIAAAIMNEYVLFPKFHPACITWLASSTAADVIITASLVYSLARQRTGFAATDDIINKVIILTVQTGLVTAVGALLDIALFEGSKGTTLNFISDFALSKLYSNSLLSTLNARGGWKATLSLGNSPLFENETGGGGITRGRTQIVAIDSGRSPNMVPMVVLGSGADYHHEDFTQAIDITHKFVDEV